MSKPTLKEVLKPQTERVLISLLEELGIPGEEYQKQQLDKASPPPPGMAWLLSRSREWWALVRLPKEIAGLAFLEGRSKPPATPK